MKLIQRSHILSENTPAAMKYLTVSELDRILVCSGKKNYIAQHIEINRCADYFR